MPELDESRTKFFQIPGQFFRPGCLFRCYSFFRLEGLLERPGRNAWYLLNLALWWNEAVAA